MLTQMMQLALPTAWNACCQSERTRQLNSMGNLRPPTNESPRTRPPIVGRRVGGLNGEVD